MNWYSYEEMLDKAYKKIEELGIRGYVRDRFEIPVPQITYQKNWTIITNSREISDILGRSMEHIARFLQKSLNVPCKVEDKNIIIQKKVPQKVVFEKIKRYVKEFVLCPVCNKPDTELVKIDRIYYIKCKACGAESPVLYKI